jgi:predicted nucleic acid-binding protein
MKLYIDTNVYLDYFLNRRNSGPAFRIFRRTINCHFQIILSDQVILELTNIIEYSQVKFLFEMLKHKLVFVKSETSDMLKAKQLNTHYSDALHIILAEKSCADVIITNNIKDFSLIFESKRPEDL